MPARHALARTRLAAVLVAVAALLLPAPAARAWSPGDTLTVVWAPLPNLPVIVTPGEAFTAWANAAPGTGPWRAWIVSDWVTLGLLPAGGGHEPSRGRWELRWRVPEGTPEDTYDLVLESDAVPPDTSRRSVRVVASRPEAFYFAQVTDTHLPTHMFSSYGSFSAADTSAQADLSAVIADLDLIHPEFVLHTGDLVNEGELEEYLGGWQMARGLEMLTRFDAPVFLVPGNHDVSGWQSTPMPDGTARRAWWRRFGWPFLDDPPPGDPRRTQDWSFDYASLHVVGMETWQYTGGYDRFRPEVYGAQSLTAQQMAWLQADLGAVPQGRAKLLALHYDFGGTLANGGPALAGSQLDPGALGLDGMVWGHWHGVPEASRAVPFDLGLQAVVDGQRTFRVFQVVGDVVLPGPMHHATGAIDSLSVTWNGPNDGTRARLSARVVNHFNEHWGRGRLEFLMPDHDSSFTATGGTVVQALRRGGRARVTVEFPILPVNVMTVEVAAAAPLAAWPEEPASGLRLARPLPNPFTPARGPVTLHVEVARAGELRVRVHDLAGRAVATLHDGRVAAGTHTFRWDGRGAGGSAAAGVYLLRAEAGGETRVRRIVLTP